MRTTIELSENQHAELLKIAAQRRMKGFSPLVQEALIEYLKSQSARHEQIEAALKLKGTMSKREADDFEATIKNLRKSWR